MTQLHLRTLDEGACSSVRNLASLQNRDVQQHALRRQALAEHPRCAEHQALVASCLCHMRSPR